MKTRFICLVLLTMFLSLAVKANFACAQISCAKVLKNSLAVIAFFEDKDFQVLHMNMSTVDKGSSSTYTTTLSSGSTYSIVAVGDDDRVQDLDLSVYDENDNLLEKDDDDKNIAIVQVTPKWTGEFRCKVKGYRMSHNDAFYAIIIIRND